MLPLNVFLNGMSFFTFGVQRSLPASSPPLRPVVVHATYQFADEPAYSYGKRQRFREHGLWKIDSASYYEGRYLQASRLGACLGSRGAGVCFSDCVLFCLPACLPACLAQVVDWESVSASLARDFQQSLSAESPQAAEALFRCRNSSDFRFPADPAMGCFHPGHTIVDLDDKEAVKDYRARLGSGEWRAEEAEAWFWYRVNFLRLLSFFLSRRSQSTHDSRPRRAASARAEHAAHGFTERVCHCKAGRQVCGASQGWLLLFFPLPFRLDCALCLSPWLPAELSSSLRCGVCALAFGGSRPTAFWWARRTTSAPRTTAPWTTTSCLGGCRRTRTTTRARAKTRAKTRPRARCCSSFESRSSWTTSSSGWASSRKRVGVWRWTRRSSRPRGSSSREVLGAEEVRECCWWWWWFLHRWNVCVCVSLSLEADVAVDMQHGITGVLHALDSLPSARVFSISAQDLLDLGDCGYSDPHQASRQRAAFDRSIDRSIDRSFVRSFVRPRPRRAY